MAQLGGLTLALAVLFWTAYASTILLDGMASRTSETLMLESRVAGFETRVAAQARDLAEIAADRARLEAERGRLEAALTEAQRHAVASEAALRTAEAETRGLRTELARRDALLREREARIAVLEADLLESGLARVDIGGSATAVPATAAVPGLGETMARVVRERDAARATATALETEVQGLLSHLKGAEQRQEILLKQLETAARTGLAGLGKVFERAEIDLDRILTAARVEYGGSGGPFQPITEAEAALPDTTEERVIALLADLERANLLKIAVARLPFGKPVEGARMTSAFGKRKDPIRRVWSMHTGMDYAAAPGTRIEATADGVVSFSGRMRGYGKIVIIKHAFGYETRYAHLRRRNVAVGQRVARGDVIGEMGNTGRSTGTHLHYEIRIDETPINPKKFIEAGRDVL